MAAAAFAEDPRLVDARRARVDAVAGQLGVADLKREGGELVGPCPRCGGTDRFAISPRKNVWGCRKCEAGGDAIALVRLVLGCDLDGALSWLVGERDVELDPRERARREAQAARDRREREARAARERERAIGAARAIWAAARPAAGTPVAAYLRLRGLPAAIADAPPASLRFHADLPYMVAIDGQATEIWRGPAMVAAVQAPSARLSAVHRTWLDLGRPSGKAEVVHGGAAQPAKKVWGAKKGGAIRLTHPRARAGDFTTLVMGEGIETTASAMAAGTAGGGAFAAAAYWAGVDLGNMGGQRRLRGEGARFAGIPDLDDAEAFLPPPWVRWLVYIQDGDSEPRLTRAKLLAGLRRARARVPSVERISIAHAGPGVDLNDVLMGVEP